MPVGLGAMVAMSAVPAVVQGVQGLIQSGKARKMLDNLERPQYEIPQSVMQGTQRAINAASSFQMPGQDAYQQSIDQASSGALYNITQNATSGPEALAAMAGVYGAQMGAQNQMALAAAQDYQRREQLAQQALMTRGEYEDKAWMTNVYQPYAEKAQAASALAEAGKINAYQAVKGLAGVGANALMMKNLGMFDKTVNNKGVDVKPYNDAVAQSVSNVQKMGGTLKSFDPASTPQFNPNLQGLNSIGQPQFKSIMERVRSSSPMMGDANATSVVPGQTTGIQFNTIPGVTDALAESPLVNQQPFNDVVNQATGGNSFTAGTANNGGVGAQNNTPLVVSNTAPVQPTAVVSSQGVPPMLAPLGFGGNWLNKIQSSQPAPPNAGFAKAQQTMDAVEAGAIQPGTYTKDQMQAQDVAAAAATAPESVVTPEVTAPSVPPAPDIEKITPLEATSLMVSRLPMDIIKSSPSLQKFAEQASTELEIAEPLFKFGGNQVETKTSTDTNIPWSDFAKGEWEYEGKKCNSTSNVCTGHSNEDEKIAVMTNGARHNLGKLIISVNNGEATTSNPSNRDEQIPLTNDRLIKLINTEGSYYNKLWKTAQMPFPATIDMIKIKIATDTNIPWKDFMSGKWTYEGEDCDLKGSCPSDDSVNGARKLLGSMVSLNDYGTINRGKDNESTMKVEQFLELVNTDGTKQNKLWKTANLPFPVTIEMLKVD